MSTLSRWLKQDGLKPWRYRSWIFPRDPDFATKAARILDLYQGIWKWLPLGDDDFVLSADEKTSIQARRRKHATRTILPHEPARIEHEYERLGAWAYLAAQAHYETVARPFRWRFTRDDLKTLLRKLADGPLTYAAGELELAA